MWNSGSFDKLICAQREVCALWWQHFPCLYTLQSRWLLSLSTGPFVLESKIKTSVSSYCYFSNLMRSAFLQLEKICCLISQCWSIVWSHLTQRLFLRYTWGSACMNLQDFCLYEFAIDRNVWERGQLAPLACCHIGSFFLEPRVFKHTLGVFFHGDPYIN